MHILSFPSQLYLYTLPNFKATPKHNMCLPMEPLLWSVDPTPSHLSKDIAPATLPYFSFIIKFPFSIRSS